MLLILQTNPSVTALMGTEPEQKRKPEPKTWLEKL